MRSCHGPAGSLAGIGVASEEHDEVHNEQCDEHDLSDRVSIPVTSSGTYRNGSTIAVQKHTAAIEATNHSPYDEPPR